MINFQSPSEQTHPYRTSSKPVEPLTNAEIAFWDATYVRLIESSSSEEAAAWADCAVEQRRERFGVR